MKKTTKEEIVLVSLLVIIQNLFFFIITVILNLFLNYKILSYQFFGIFISLYILLYTDLIILTILGLRKRIIDHISDDNGFFEKILNWYQKKMQPKRNLYFDAIILKIIIFIIFRIIFYSKMKIFNKIIYKNDLNQSKILFYVNNKCIEQNVSIITKKSFGVDKVLELLMKENPALVIQNYLK